MRWASAVDTDSNLSSAVERAAGTVFTGLGRQEPDLVFVFVGADHAPRFDAVSDLLLREFESAFLFGCCAGGVIGSIGAGRRR
jgi:small ligand-binding sensory domain FIST